VFGVLSVVTTTATITNDNDSLTTTTKQQQPTTTITTNKSLLIRVARDIFRSLMFLKWFNRVVGDRNLTFDVNGCLDSCCYSVCLSVLV
jgi:hypothetical protein